MKGLYCAHAFNFPCIAGDATTKCLISEMKFGVPQCTDQCKISHGRTHHMFSLAIPYSFLIGEGWCGNLNPQN